MVRMFLILLFLLINLSARENPFFPAEGEMDIPVSSNSDFSLPPLKRATITLPPEARVINSVTISYKNLDGSIENKSIKLENSVDWHLPIFISQSYTKLKNNSKKIIKESQKKRVILEK